MKIIIENKVYDIIETGKFGREGEIYSVNYCGYPKAVKVYNTEKRTDFLERKILAMINKFNSLNLSGIEDYIAYPEIPIYDPDGGGFCGFLMKIYDQHHGLYDLKYDLKTKKYKTQILDNDALNIIINLFTYLNALHRAGFVIGDISPDNILLDKSLYPVIVDFDSAQIGTYYSTTTRMNYIHPAVRRDGVGRNKYFIYTTESDIFSLSVICYEFVIGVHPYYFSTSEVTDTRYKKDISLSLMDYIEGNTEKISRHGLEVYKNKYYDATVKRLDEVRQAMPDLYNFFKSIFVNGDARYFKPNAIKVKQEDTKRSISTEHNLIPQTKKDPPELEFFVKLFNINI
jgi:serine/threonine protein kinase